MSKKVYIPIYNAGDSEPVKYIESTEQEIQQHAKDMNECYNKED